ncbi:MAG: energy-coupling factor ABC transporter ATP-binding protein [Dehalococcoidales bacterium]|jgi:cobalt transport protein ATP-binding subunit|nr:energy-coupling factor ABC transporter ATP-binding protein [Dehalococcoidales bacterium]
MIKTEALSFSYDGCAQALCEINLELRDGEFLALLGANGCGKTTLLKHLNGLLKPSSGRVCLGDRELRFFKDEEIFRRVGMVFQDPNDQLFGATVAQDVAFGVVNLGLKPDEVARRTAEALGLVGASELPDKAIHTLSFGQKRRVAIAGVLAMGPQTILLDEPTSGLDPRGVSLIMRLLRKLNREGGIAMLMATHDVELVPLFSDRVAIMSQGQIITEGPPGKVFANTSMIREAELRLPRVSHLFEILQKKEGLNFPEMPMTIGEARRELIRFLESSSHGKAEGISLRVRPGEPADDA